jgi:restriction system protein
MINGVDRRTGREKRACILSVQVSREEYQQLNLARVDPIECLKYLKARTSPSQKELIPIEPIVTYNTADSRFIDNMDVLSQLDSRANLLEMNPFDFEHLISNLFTQMGFKTSTTRASRDGGIDVVAFDERPILGGKVVIQAKRYRNTVEVSAVRDLYGSMMNEGATKGILVTTSVFGAESRKFAKDKPIELIDGNQLLYLLEKHGYNLKIEFPK